MIDEAMLSQMQERPGFVAALDQSGGSTPLALRHYGVADDDYDDDESMFMLMHEMRLRIITAPAFDRAEVVATILFERTMDGLAHGQPVPTFLWEQRGVVPLLKIDRGLEPESTGVRLMKPVPDLDDLLARAGRLGVFGTKMRSVVDRAVPAGVAAVVAQQFDFADQVDDRRLMPILELEVSIDSPEKAACEAMLLAELTPRLDALPAGRKVMLKLTLPETPNLYADLTRHARVARVLALSGGYPRDEACRRLAANRDVIASFSRALIEDLRRPMSDEVFDATLAESMKEIFLASTVKAVDEGGAVRAGSARSR